MELKTFSKYRTSVTKNLGTLNETYHFKFSSCTKVCSVSLLIANSLKTDSLLQLYNIEVFHCIPGANNGISLHSVGIVSRKMHVSKDLHFDL